MTRMALHRIEMSLRVLHLPGEMCKDVNKLFTMVRSEEVKRVLLDIDDKAATITVEKKDCNFQRSYTLV